MSSHVDAEPLWSPTQAEIERANITQFAREVITQRALTMNNWAAFYEWSITDTTAFWEEVWDFCHIIGHKGDRVLTTGHHFIDAQWFPDAQLNYAENLLRFRDESDAIVFYNEQGYQSRMSWASLNQAVRSLASIFQSWGIQPGDRVVAVMPNIPETVVCYLAAATIGAIFSACSPDFGTAALLDRFQQLAPTVLVVADGYWFKGEAKETLSGLPALAEGLPTLQHGILVPYLHITHTLPPLHITMNDYPTLLAQGSPSDVSFTRFPFNHPLTILFSSGTTGKPKCIVHSAGGTLIQHLKEHVLHADLCAEDRLFFYTTTAWMMWHWLVSGLATGATIMLFDGNPTHQKGGVLFDYIKKEKITHFGTSAKFIHYCMKENLSPRVLFNLDQETQLRMILSTGSPLSSEGFHYVYSHIKKHICLSSCSGGTDIISCFALGNPILPVYAGELQCLGLGMAVSVWNEHGEPIVGEKGELVCTKPFPSMPIGFWQDHDNKLYQESYFDDFPGVWTHGDFSEITAHGGLMIYGRSDNTLKPSGIRIGTAEIYRALEPLTDIEEALATNYPVDDDIRILLLVQMKPGLTLTPEWIERIQTTILKHTTARHVPKALVQVHDLPRTKTGKLAEKVIHHILHQQPIRNQDALSNPEVIPQLAAILVPYYFPTQQP